MDREAIAKGREIGEGDVLSWFERDRALQEERRARRVAIAREWLVFVVGAWTDLGGRRAMKSVDRCLESFQDEINFGGEFGD